MKTLKRLLPEVLKKPLRRIRDRMVRFLQPPLESFPNAPDIFHGYRELARHPELTRSPGGWVYQGVFYPDYITVGGASFAIFKVAAEHCKGTGVDVGAGFWPLPGAIPVDLTRGEGLGKSPSDFADGSLDFVFSSHCLEHIENWREALAEWVRKIKPGGKLFLYLPHPDCGIWRPGAPMVGTGHKWSPTPTIIVDAIRSLGCDVVSRDDGPDFMYSFHVCATKIPPAAAQGAA